jgi:hypothetical protein
MSTKLLLYLTMASRWSDRHISIKCFRRGLQQRREHFNNKYFRCFLWSRTSLFWRYKNYGSTTWSEWGQLPSVKGYLADGIILYEAELKVVDSAGNQSAGTITASQLSVDRIFNGTLLAIVLSPGQVIPIPELLRGKIQPEQLPTVRHLLGQRL